MPTLTARTSPSRQTLIQEDTYYRILRALEANPEISQRDLARQLGISVGGLNYCLKALMTKGLVKLENFQHSRHKFKYVYLLTPSGIAEKATMTKDFLRRKMDEYEALRAEIEVLTAEVLARGAEAAIQPSASEAEGVRNYVCEA
jgi:EPS-associated MarR family transcriptional regulator